MSAFCQVFLRSCLAFILLSELHLVVLFHKKSTLMCFPLISYVYEYRASYKLKSRFGIRFETFCVFPKVERQSINLRCIAEALFTSKERLSYVMTLNMKYQICDIARYNYRLKIRLAGVSDLIVSEANYHLACFSAFKSVVYRI